VALTPGTRFGSFEITSLLGAGGMGEVYLARDTRLDRPVAIKVLLAAVASDPDRLARFEREAKLLASLNHPHIAQIYGLEDSGGTRALVMELVEGATLADRIAEGALPLDEALPIARQIAAALEAAHEQGIIHRDLKPANIKLRPDGTVKVLDFGLAKLTERGAAGGTDVAGLTMSPTITSPAMTQAGLILGTAAYMRPEQARGKAVDKRADIWAFGVVFYEMLAGHRPFKGEDLTETLASVVKDQSDLSQTPMPVRRLLAKCLEKDPRRRLRDIGDVWDLLDAAAPAASPAPARARRAPWVVAAACTIVAAVAGWGLKPVPAADLFPARTVLNVDGEYPIGSAVISEDGRSVVYAGASRSGNGRVLYRRRLDQLTSSEIAGTDAAGAGAPALSPDGKWVAYIANRRKLMKVPLEGGAAVALADVADYGGIDWSPSGDIVLGGGISEGLQGLSRVKESGGGALPFTQVDTASKELSHQRPRVLADGKTVLFTIWFGASRDAQIAAASLDDDRVVRLGVQGINALGVVDGQLVYVSADGVAMAVPFDVTTRRTMGTPAPVQDSIRVKDVGEGFLTHGGALSFLRGNNARRLVWVDRAGTVVPVGTDSREYESVRLSPDGRRVAANILTGVKADLWSLDLTAGTLTPLTATGVSRNASWSPDGSSLVYVSTQGGRAQLWRQPTDGSGPAVLAAVPPHNPWQVDLAPDGRSVVFNALYNGTFNLEILSLDSAAGSGRSARELAGSATAAESRGRFSPDGRWIAYNSDESGRVEVFIRSSADTGGRVAISVNGGQRPVWAHDGRQVFYWQGNRMVSATLAFDPAPRVVSRASLFEGDYEDVFDVAKDGRFLLIESATSGVSLVVVPNWRTDLRRLTAR
jgi:Tol biopolymer transport system component/tRNA A-37 threonylcarbamoyl transferase component Bud32